MQGHEMIHSSVFFLLLVGAAFANTQNAWEDGKQYSYAVRSRTLAAFNHQSKQFTGVLIEAKLTVQPHGPNTLRAKICQPRYSQIHTRLENGWESEIPPEQMNMESFPLSEKPFEIKTQNGTIQELIISKDVPTWEVNIVKSVISQLNIDTLGENALRSEYNQLSEGSQPKAFYKTMEDSVSGRCETVYDISPLPEQILQNKPELAPMPQLRENGDIINIMKTKNYTNCDQRVSYHFGIDRRNDGEPDSNDNSKYLSRSTISQVVVSGNLKKYTIQSSVTTNKMEHNAGLYKTEQGIVASKINLTLYEVKDISESISAPSNPESTGNLVYSYNNPFGQPNSRRPNQPNLFWNSKYQNQNYRKNQGNKQHSYQQSSDETHESYDSNESVYDNEEASYLEPKPKLTEPSKNPMDAFFIGNGGNCIQHYNKIDPVKTAKDIAREIGTDIQKPESMFEEGTLDKYTTLTRLIRIMNAEQIAQVHRLLYEPENESFNHRNQDRNILRNSWVAFRDAVAQAGTGPALVNVKQWIHNEQIKSYEAAEVVGIIAQVVRTPTPEYIEAYFELVKLQQSKEQPLLRDAAVLAFADLLRHAVVDRASRHNRYPVHTYGKFFSNKGHRDIHEKYIPYLTDELRKAVDSGDSRQIQVYTAALGRVADPRILSILEPYLEGKKPVSRFQRYVMVQSLHKLAIVHPNVARPILYKIYSNNADYYEIRIAAFYLLMMTNPPLSMIQRIAEYTNYDSNKQVNSAVKSTIQSLALYEDIEYADIFNVSKATESLLTPENYENQYSQSTIYSFKSPQTQSGLFFLGNYIGSDDNVLPKGVYAHIRQKYKGLKLSSFEAGASISSVHDLWSFMQKLISKQSQNKKFNLQKNQEHKYSPEQISKLLGIYGDEPNQLEGFLYGNGRTGNYFISFDNHTLEKIPEELKYLASQLRTGKYYGSTRFNNYEITISFPTETGFPFQFNLMIPSVAHIDGYSQLIDQESDNESSIPKSTTLDGKIRITYGMEVQKRLGFVSPFENQEYLVGVNKNVQIDLPVRSKVSYDKNRRETRVIVQPNEDMPEFKILQYKTEPFTSKRDIFNMEPITKDMNTHIINKDRTTKSQIGLNDMNNKQIVEFHWERLTWNSQDENERRENRQHNDRAAMQKLLQSLMEISFVNHEVNAEYEKYSVKLSPSADTKVEIKSSYDLLITENNNDIEDYKSWSPKATAPRLNQTLNESERKQKLMREAVKDINSAQADAVNFNLKVSGGTQASLDITAATAYSHIDPKSRFMLYALATDNGKGLFLSTALEAKIPNVKSLDYEQTLKNNKPREFEADIHLGESSNNKYEVLVGIKIQGKTEQTEERKNSIRQSRDAQDCNREQSQNGNKLSYTCLLANQRAEKVNIGEMTIKLEDIYQFNWLVLNSVDAAEQYLGNFINTDIEKNLDSGLPLNEIKVNYELSPNDEMFNLSVNTHVGKMEINNIRMSEIYNLNSSTVKDTKNNENLDTHINQKAVCNLDKSEAKTFDNKRYLFHLGQCWHVAMTTYPMNNADNPNEQLEIPEEMHVSVLMNEDENGMKQLKVTIGDEQIELWVTSSRQVHAKINGEAIELSYKKNYQGKLNEKVIFDLFNLEDGTATIVSDIYDVKVLFDGSRAQIMVGNRYRKSLRGLCGNYDGEPENDQKTPKGCTLQRPEEFVATYALTQEDHCIGPAHQNVQKAKDSECTFEQVRPGNVISEQEAGREHSYNSQRPRE